VTGRRGFTLIEMLIVLVLISISVAVVYPSMFKTRDHFDSAIEAAGKAREEKRVAFNHFITDGLPQKSYSSATGLKP
jgi:prepilin-type N-terminal cleavage/methylation domain-containing protein